MLYFFFIVDLIVQFLSRRNDVLFQTIAIGIEDIPDKDHSGWVVDNCIGCHFAVKLRSWCLYGSWRSCRYTCGSIVRRQNVFQIWNLGCSSDWLSWTLTCSTCFWLILNVLLQFLASLNKRLHQLNWYIDVEITFKRDQMKDLTFVVISHQLDLNLFNKGFPFTGRWVSWALPSLNSDRYTVRTLQPTYTQSLPS